MSCIPSVLSRAKAAAELAAEVAPHVRDEGSIKFGAIRSGLDAAVLELQAAADAEAAAAPAA